MNDIVDSYIKSGLVKHLYQLSEFEEWWYNEGSGIVPEDTEDQEEHAKRVAEAAWNMATDKANER
jgi:hypothetical protein